MMCQFNDGLKVSFCGPLRIHKEEEINVSLESGEIPDNIHGELIDAALQGSCNEIRQVVQEVTEAFGKKVPEGRFDGGQYSEYFEQ